MKILIRLGGCPGWSESSLCAQSFCWFVMRQLNYIAYVQSSTNGTIGMPIPSMVLPLVEPVAPILPTIGYQYCRQPRTWARLPVWEDDIIQDGVEKIRVEERGINAQWWNQMRENIKLSCTCISFYRTVLFTSGTIGAIGCQYCSGFYGRQLYQWHHWQNYQWYHWWNPECSHSFLTEKFNLFTGVIPVARWRYR